MLCEDCGCEYEIKKGSYKRKYPNKCPLHALVNRETKTSNPTHGHRKVENGKPRRTKLYIKWVQMKMTCNNPKYKDYRLVGALGIKICDEWNTYEGFHKWAMSKFYKEGMMLKRLDVKLDFTPKNCKFLLSRANRFYEFKGKPGTIHTIKKELGSKLEDSVIRGRLEKGWNLEDAFLQPIGFKMRRGKRREKIAKMLESKEILTVGKTNELNKAV